MTLDELEKMDCLTITPAIAAEVIGCNPQYIRIQAHQRPELLGFPVFCVGSHTRIPRIPFINYLRTGHAG